jgi:hypothetical protein
MYTSLFPFLSLLSASCWLVFLSFYTLQLCLGMSFTTQLAIRRNPLWPMS